jgi:DNA modification methylase
MALPIRKFTNKILCGDAYHVLKQIPNESVDCVVTSPPYWALRDYGVKGQLGLESTFAEYVEKLCNVFDEVKRVLKNSGTCWP